MNEINHAQYGLKTLRQLQTELKNSPCGNQIEKYDLTWIAKEIKREEKWLNLIAGV